MDQPSLGLAVLLVTALSFAGMGVVYSIRRVGTIEDFVTARGSVGGFASFATLLASAVGAWVLFSPVEAGSIGGLAALVGYGIGAAAPLLLFAVVGPRMRDLMPRGHSLTEYVWHRFGRLTYALTLAIAVFYMFIFLAAEMTGIALAVHLVVGTPLGVTALLIGLATLAYTTYGGLKASIFTDTIQAWLIVPLLAVLLVATTVALGGPGPIAERIGAQQPQLLDLRYVPGVEFGAAVVIAILAANMFHQGYWQRVYAARSTTALRWAFVLAAVVIAPVVALFGLFGLLAVSLGEVAQPSTALFVVVLEMMPDWVLLALLVLAVALVMSSVDTLINGIASLVASDLARLRPGLPSGQLVGWSRIVSVLLPLPTIVIAAQGYSVLYLFLIADMVCAAAVFPIFFGMFARRFGGRAATLSILVGLAVGTFFFPDPGFTRGSLLHSFAGALTSSALVAIVLNAVAAWQRRETGYDFDRLRRFVHPLGS